MSPRWRQTALILAAMIAVACVGALVVVLRQLKTDSAKQPAIAPIDARQLIESKNVGLAHLENHDTARSTPVFVDLAAKLSEDPLGPMNLAVSRVVALGEEYEQATPERLEEARAALALVRKTAGATRDWRWLSARVEAAAQNFVAAEEHLAKIVADEPLNASAWYELFLVRQATRRDDKTEDMFAALALAFDLRPDNLFLLVEYLRQLEERLGQRQAAIERLPAGERAAARRRAIAEYGDMAARLRQVRQTLAPFQDRLKAISRADVVQLMDEALAAAENANLQQLADRAGQVARLTLGMAAADRNQIHRHALEFVVVRFRPEFYEQHGLLETEPTAAIDVSFVTTPALQLDPELVNQLKDVRAVAAADFDLDGRLDLVVLDAAGIHVFGRAADSESWQVIASSAAAAGMTGLIVQDLDLDFDEMPNSGQTSSAQGPRSDAQPANGGIEAQIAQACASADVDIVAFGPDGLMVLRNRYTQESGKRSLERIEQPLDSPTGVTAATAADLDADGDLDLVIAGSTGLSVWSNRGNATFEDISSRSSLPPPDARISGFVAVDWDRDVDVDILTSGEPSGWLENLRHGQMRWHSFAEGFGMLQSARALEIVDADANASWDLVAAKADGLHLLRTTTPQSGVVRPLEGRAISERGASGPRALRAFDYDNDGVADLLAWDDERLTIYRGMPDGRFQIANLFEAPPATIRDCAIGDIDGDGDLDLIVAAPDGISIFVNQSGNANNWLDLALKARQIKGSETSASGRVNAHGVGNLLEVKAGTRYQAAVVRGQTTHFGLGRRASADVVRVLWLNGVPQNIIQPTSNRAVCEQQLLTGSCPYLYAWNGTAFEFVTDLLWASPLGLQAADGVLLPAREWEHIKIPGEKLAERDGEYVLQLTEELWEAAYFDEVKLIAIDHPAGVDIYSNEKVGPAEMAAFKIHTARDKRRPVAARNHRGRDLLPELAEEDGVYAQAFDQKLRQGLAEEHFIELDLGDLREAKKVTLFLIGWIYPSGTSLNVAISQNPELPQPKPPALLVPDGNGGWREALAYMGFPGGKTKTIAIDLSEVLNKDDGRVRIVTTLEFYWDQIFFTVDEPQVELRQTELELKAAELHRHGFSRIVHDVGNGPERFLYDELGTAPKWPPMQGRFTRFGDVTELLRTRDDRLLVLGAGDEATLRFPAPASDPPAGWKRDFLLYSVGWDKDANLCTVLGQSSEPLPYAAMTSYPPSLDDRAPETPVYRRYLREYQTRTQGGAFWQAVRGWDGTR